MKTAHADINLIEAIENVISALRANKYDGFHGTYEDHEYFEIILDSVLRDLEQAISEAKGEA